jgi:hypothetical protein
MAVPTRNSFRASRSASLAFRKEVKVLVNPMVSLLKDSNIGRTATSIATIDLCAYPSGRPQPALVEVVVER